MSVAVTPSDCTPPTWAAAIRDERCGSSPNVSAERLCSGTLKTSIDGPSITDTPAAFASRPIAVPSDSIRSGSKVAAAAIGCGKAVAGSAVTTPGGPSANTIPGTSSRSTPCR